MTVQQLRADQSLTLDPGSYCCFNLLMCIRELHLIGSIDYARNNLNTAADCSISRNNGRQGR
jgi:hypothetical protein